MLRIDNSKRNTVQRNRNVSLFATKPGTYLKELL